jgi:glycerol-3-phosphate dehydrogenase
MAEDGINQAARLAGLTAKTCVTQNLRIHGCPEHRPESHAPLSDVYGSDRVHIQALIDQRPEWGTPLGEKFGLTQAEVIWAVRAEMARTIEDVLSRRSRILLLDAREANVLAEPVAEIMTRELKRSKEWKSTQISDFGKLADQSLEVG